jgi:hypothetical protein
MEELSQELTAFLLSQSGFTTVMAQRLSPVITPADETFPFANYVITQQSGQSKDGSAYNVVLACYFKAEGYLACVRFLDLLKPIIESNYDWESSTVEFVQEDQSFVGIINFNAESYGSQDAGIIIPEEPSCNVPVITKFSDFQFGSRSFQKGVTSYLQIQANNNPTSYNIYIPFLTDAQGITVDVNTGLITLNYNGDATIILLNYSATNECGTKTESSYLLPINSDINALVPPINLTASDYNSSIAGPSFILASEFLPYSGTIAKVEYYKNDILYKTFEGSTLNNFVGPVGDRMQGLEDGQTYGFKIRIQNNLGEYSEFSEVLTVTVPF